ncbi:YisB protein [Phlyctema vagabunda]|uniref:YisB protein n=1 Tax=Phlyctema vagabunda TaxID=108571 RepID=A0ABR4PSZ4_9HELO
MITDDEISNFELFRDCLSTPLIDQSIDGATKKTRKRKGNGRKNAIKPVSAPAEREENDAAELAEFIDYIATEIFTSLPLELRLLTYSDWLNEPSLQSRYSLPLDLDATISVCTALPLSVAESFETYSLLPSTRTVPEFLNPIFNSYLTTLTKAPPPPALTKDQFSECEICDRSWIPLTYHHLIPKDSHTRVLKRGWHTEDQLQNVAWICRACHTFVHKIATNEELAKDYYTVDKLLERDDVQKFAAWVAKIRWKCK